MKKRKKHRPQKHGKRDNASSSQQSKKMDWETYIIFGLCAGLLSGACILAGSSISLGVLIGLLIGFAALPYFDPKKWKHRPIVCAFLGGAIGCVASLERTSTWEMMVVFGLVGAVVGYFATTWVPHISLP